MTTSFTEDLSQHFTLCEEILALTQSENRSLRDPERSSQFESYQARKGVLPRLNSALQALRRNQAAWNLLPPSERAQRQEVLTLVRKSQDLIMKILMLDRENEQCMLRRGLVPSRHLPAPARQRPHFVADLYRRNGLASAHAD
jgi:hypothetical protein